MSGSGRKTPLDDGDSPATAIPLAVGASIEGELSADDIDYFRVTVSNAGTLMASTTGSTDTYGSIEDSSGNVLSTDDDSGADYNFRVSVAVEPGTYYIRVRGYDDSSTGPYTLTLQMEEGSDGSGGDRGTGTIRRLTYHPARDLSPSWSPDGRHIAFASDRDGNGDIYVMGSDGSNPRNLTNHSGYASSPSWSPDGRHIAFASDRDGNGDIYVMSSDGSSPRRLTDHSDRDNDRDNRSPSWSPDGRHIAFYHGAHGVRIYVMGSDGSNPRRLPNYRAGSSPSWSPDGRYIAFVSAHSPLNSDIYVMGSDGSNPRNLTNHSGYASSPSWSPDGRHIAFVSDRDGNYEIYVMEFRQEGSGGTPLDQGDSPATATPLVVGESIEGVLSNDDIDYFRVTVSNAGMLVASTTGSTDTYGSIEDSSGNILDENDDDGEGSNFRVSVAVEPGTYYIRVKDPPGFSRTGDYTLTVQSLAFDDSDVKAKQARIAEKLFGLRLYEADSLTYYDYNNYRALPHNDTDKCDGYLGGHSGWDVQTQSVAGNEKTADEEFYSLTSGEVIAIGGTLGKIAVYNATANKTTLYLHARAIYVSQGQTVNVGTALGIQGNVGLGFSNPSVNEHVHIEVRDGWSEYASCGAGATQDPINIDPIDYLYESIDHLYESIQAQ